MIEELHDDKLKDLELKANQIRQLIIESLVEAGSGHSAGPLGMTDIFTAFTSISSTTTQKIQTGKTATGWFCQTDTSVQSDTRQWRCPDISRLRS